jgi:hypothetical protein
VADLGCDSSATHGDRFRHFPTDARRVRDGLRHIRDGLRRIGVLRKVLGLRRCDASRRVCGRNFDGGVCGFCGRFRRIIRMSTASHRMSTASFAACMLLGRKVPSASTACTRGFFSMRWKRREAGELQIPDSKSQIRRERLTEGKECDEDREGCVRGSEVPQGGTAEFLVCR